MLAIKIGFKMGFNNLKRFKLLGYLGDTARIEVAEAKKIWLERQMLHVG